MPPSLRLMPSASICAEPASTSTEVFNHWRCERRVLCLKLRLRIIRPPVGTRYRSRSRERRSRKFSDRYLSLVPSISLSLRLFQLSGSRFGGKPRSSCAIIAAANNLPGRVFCQPLRKDGNNEKEFVDSSSIHPNRNRSCRCWSSWEIYAAAAETALGITSPSRP